MSRAFRSGLHQGASGRPWFLWLALAVAAPCGAAGADASCPRPAPTSPAGVRHVIDGDTVVLDDGRHLRFVGINAPELGKQGAPDEPWAAAAHRRLATLVSEPGLELFVSPEPRDRHGRWLGDLLDARGASLQERLVDDGLAFAIAIPPNLAAVDCLFAAEGRARAARRGLWAEPGAWRLEAASLPVARRGFAMVSGRISSRHARDAGVSLWLDERLEVWIPAAARPAFGAALAELQPGAFVTVRGWIGSYRGHANLRIEHPAMLERAR